MPKTITFTVEVNDDFDSLNELENFVNQEGQKLKQELFENLAENITVPDRTFSCPNCGNEKSIATGQKGRKLKTIFGDVTINSPRRQCKKCYSYFFPLGRGFLGKGMSRPN